MNKKAEMKEIRKDDWIKKILKAKEIADKAIIDNPSDELPCCNLDSAMVKKEECFTYAETIQIFKECGIPAFRLYGLYRGWFLVGECHGVAERNTLWAKTFAQQLGKQGFKTSVWYQLD